MQKKADKVEVSSSEPEEVENSDEEEEIDEQQEMESDEDKNLSDNEAEAGPSGSDVGEKSAKKKKRGIIYISSIPKHMNVTILREMLSERAKIGRIFLQPGKLSSKLNRWN